MNSNSPPHLGQLSLTSDQLNELNNELQFQLLNSNNNSAQQTHQNLQYLMGLVASAQRRPTSNGHSPERDNRDMPLPLEERQHMNPQSQSLEVSKQPTGRDQAVKNKKLMAELVELKEEINKLKTL